MYKHYLTSVGLLASAVTVVMNLILQVFQIGTNYWLALWSDDAYMVSLVFNNINQYLSYKEFNKISKSNQRIITFTIYHLKSTFYKRHKNPHLRTLITKINKQLNLNKNIFCTLKTKVTHTKMAFEYFLNNLFI